MIEQFEKLVKTRQSCRNFNDKPLEKETVYKIADLARFSPSACNSQPWHMYCVTSPDKVKQVAKAVQGMTHNKFASGAKAFMVLCNKMATLKPGVESKFDRNFFVKYDVGELIAYITLTAESMGVSSCIIGWLDPKDIQKIVGHPEKERCEIVVALGYSDIPVREKVRKPAEETITEI